MDNIESVLFDHYADNTGDLFNTSCENINYTPISLYEIREIMSIKNERT